ncbi:MAG: homocysteine S-methyltransferase family protein [Sporomusaceae bacterium]|nr:homocysteine S-methyltransferase family protein [Sporomusaceae bacterium]
MILFDGAMGTMLQQAGLPAGACPEAWCLLRPELITAIHKQYVDSGAEIIETNTFGASRVKLAHYGLADSVKPICFAAVRAAREACLPSTKIAGSVGPSGQLLQPLGELSFEDAYQAFAEQIAALDEAGADYILIETIIDIQEMRAALLAAKAVTAKPVICQLTFEKDGRTVTGTDPATAAVILDKLGADIIGANCSLGPAQLLDVVKAMTAATAKPIIIQPNAGMPELENGQTHYHMSPDEFAAWIPRLAEAGAAYLGGCCGTTPAHIQAARQVIDQLDSQPRQRQLPEKTVVLASRSRHIYIGKNYPTAVIGERINPTGRKLMAQELKSGNFQMVKREALAQVQAGAVVLDVNMGVAGIDQTPLMKYAVEQLAVMTNVPLAIDTTDPAALEAGLRAFPGRALINSVSAEPERIETFLPLAKKYGAAVLCLPLTPAGVPSTAAERVAIAGELIAAAKSAGLTDNDLLLDALTLTVAADQTAAQETLRTLAAYRTHFGIPAVMGLSNVSFGLPRRDLLNGAFCAMALAAGLDAPILNPHAPLMQDILAASAVLLGKDQHAKYYAAAYAQSTPAPAAAAAVKPAVAASALAGGELPPLLQEIKQCVITGEKDRIKPLVEQALAAKHTPLEITDLALSGAMNDIGKDFGTGLVFLPQVLLSAETMKVAFEAIRAIMPAHQTVSRGTVLLATVKGDIHDLGKNIVAALLENNGFQVIDLGKDVSAEKVVDAALKHNADIVGLCALMTTTLPQIDITIQSLRTAGCEKAVIAGGAVLTAEYASSVGASYAADAVAAVAICKEITKASSLTGLTQ